MKESRLLMVLLSLAAGVLSAQTPLNVVFILADDVGAHDLGCYGSTFHLTPNLDALAAKGVRLTQASASPSCSPTRASILTGFSSARIGITQPVGHFLKPVLTKRLNTTTDQRSMPALSLTRLNPHFETLAEQFKAAGYRTAHFGKWHLGAKPYSPLEHGFESDWPGMPGPGPGGPTGYFSPWIYAPDVPQTPGEHIEDRLASEALAWIREHRDEPFFLNYWALSAHGPWMAKPELVDYYRQRIQPGNPQANPVYAAMLHTLDEAVGSLIRGIEELGLAEQTIIVFSSDNGGTHALDPTLMKNFGFTVPPTSNRPFRGGKGTVYEGGTRVPTMFVMPGTLPANSVSSAMFDSTDFLPTLLTLAGLPQPSTPLDGIDQSTMLTGGPPLRNTIFCHKPHGLVFRNSTESGKATSFRHRNLKLIRFYNANDDLSDHYELYDLDQDPGESYNLAARHPANVARLKGMMNAVMKEQAVVIPRLNPKRLERTLWSSATGSTVANLGGRVIAASKAGRTEIKVDRPPAAAGLLVLSMRFKTYGPSKHWLLRWTTAKGNNPPKAFSTEFSASTSGDWVLRRVPFTAIGELKSLIIAAEKSNSRIQFDWIRLERKNGTIIKTWDF